MKLSKSDPHLNKNWHTSFYKEFQLINFIDLNWLKSVDKIVFSPMDS